jgi:hypothetical protein
MRIALNAMARPAPLWWLFVATAVLTAVFVFLIVGLGLTFIDGIADPAYARQVVAGMPADERSIHAWLTGTLDVAYPIAYGTFFAASTLYFFPVAGHYLAWLPLLAIPVDLLEGVVQILALSGAADWLSAKAVLTPLKAFLFWCGLATTLAGWLKWTYRRMTNRERAEES